MKKISLILGILLLATPASAGGYHHKKIVINKTTINNTYVENINEDAKNIAGAKLDAPNLVRFNRDWTLGAEVAKDLLNTNIDEGWVGYAKLTWHQILWDLSKK